MSYQKLNTYKFVFSFFTEYLLIITSILLFNHLPLAFSILFIPFLATRMYGLYSLLHDGVHYLLIKDKFWNDTLSNIFLAYPLFTTIATVRKKHFQHHVHLKEAEDPEANQNKYKEFQFPMKKATFLILVLKDLSGYNFIYYQIRDLLYHQNFKKGLLQMVLIIGIVGGFILDVHPIKLFFYCWIIPYTTFFQLLNRFRLIFEHYNIENEAFSTRSMVFHPVVAFFIAPHNLGYHTAHHLHPNVPFYNLKKVHKDLIQKGTKIKIDKNPLHLLQNILK